MILGKIEELTLKRNGICESVENLKTKKSTDQTLIDIKTKSMEYILGKNRCPVCNKSVKQSKEMISVIEKEISGVRQSVDDTAANISRQTAEFNKVNSEIEIETDLKRLLEQISLLNLKDARLQLARELENIAEESVNNILTKTNSNSLDDVMMNFNIIMANIGSIQSRINDNSHNLKVETTKYKQYQGQLKIMNTKRESLLTQKLAIETELKNQLIDLSASSVEDLTTKDACKNILEIITKKKSIEQRIALKLEGLNSIRDRVISLKTDLRNRILALEKLIAKENQLKEANRELRHLKFLRGETDGFVSKYV